MEWQEQRDTLTTQKINFKNLFFKPKFNDQDKNDILKKTNYTCRTCGGHYKSYLIMSYIAQESCFDLYCNACNIITHLNVGLKGVDIYYSTLPQLDIVKKTVEFVINNNTVPKPNIIDPSVKEVQISLLEYINLLDHIGVDTFKDYKIFFNDDFNTRFITQNYNNACMFINDDEKSVEKNNDIQFEIHNLNAKETKLLNKLFPK
jgi:hypothetical protein